jgi:hypothetical protein
LSVDKNASVWEAAGSALCGWGLPHSCIVCQQKNKKLRVGQKLNLCVSVCELNFHKKYLVLSALSKRYFFLCPPVLCGVGVFLP